MTTVPTPSDSQDGARRRDDAEPLSLDQAVDKIKKLGETILWFDQQRELLFAQVNGLRADVAQLEAKRDEARARANEAARLSAEARDQADDLRRLIANLREEIAVIDESRTEMTVIQLRLEEERDGYRAESQRLGAKAQQLVRLATDLRAQRDTAIDLLDQLADDDPCEYDHHDYCQTHHLLSRPCATARAIALLAAVDQTAPSSPLETPHTADVGEAGVVEGAGGSEAAEACPHRNRRCPRCRCVLDAGHDGDHDVHCGNGGGNG